MIKSDKYYTAEEIVMEGLFPWTQNARVVRNYIAALVKIGDGRKYSIILKPGNVDGITKRHGNRYFIKGEGLIKIIANFEDGSLFGG